MIRLLVADDHDVLRFGLQTLLSEEPDFTIIGMAADGRSAVDIAVAQSPDVVLMDLSMPVLDGIAATREIRSAAPTVRVLVLTSYCEESIVREAFEAGASGYILKDSPPVTLVEAIRAIHRGETPTSPMIPGVQDILGVASKGGQTAFD